MPNLQVRRSRTHDFDCASMTSDVPVSSLEKVCIEISIIVTECGCVCQTAVIDRDLP
ncbi:MAG: hypothetical protein ACYSW3_09180 [Planctomycetota bacterium]